ncbi:TetR/AcrR family transcriptional regulator [Oceanobacillus locisalsi]|uniref:TetR/AcrR family transcriptional regulator n=1 Tax=Oceanobacillus locisalsi TaxID=546107 RepID=A0ABW3NJK7_9BACI
MKVNNRKELIFQAAIKVISEKGINNFSIQNVCDEAEISKGGLMYHFASKEILITSLHEYIIGYIEQLIMDEKSVRETYTEAYLHACLLAAKSDETKTYMSLFNYEVNEETKVLWEKFYEEVVEELSKELSDEWVTLVVLTTNGIFTKDNYYSETELESVLNLLVNLIKSR